MIRTRCRIPSYARGKVVGECLLAFAVVIFYAVVGGKHIGPLRTRQGLAVRTDACDGSSCAVPKFDPDQWWKTRSGIRTEMVELQKLVFAAVDRHSVSLPGTAR